MTALEAALSPRLDALGAWAWGGGAARQRLTDYYRGERTVIYLADASPAVGSQLGLVSDTAGPITLVHAPGPLAFYDQAKRVVHPLLVYSDLLAEDNDRACDAAQELYEQLLKPLEAGDDLTPNCCAGTCAR